jgi:hypothetical protein
MDKCMNNILLLIIKKNNNKKNLSRKETEVFT